MNIYEYLGIDKKEYTFKRDYILNPLQKNVAIPTGGYKYEEPDINDIKYLYLTLNKSSKEMNTIFGCKISDKLSKWCNKREYMRTPKLSKMELIDLLYNKKIPMIDIAKKLNYKGTQPIQDWCNYYGIELNSPRYLKNKFNRELLYDLYINKCMTIDEICKEYSSEKSSVSLLLHDYGLMTKDNKEKRLYNFHIKENSNYEIIYDKNKLKEIILSKKYTSQHQMANDLKVSFNILNKEIKKNNYSKLFDIRRSLYEEELSNLFPHMVKNDRITIYPLEIDLYDDIKKIGIEFNGNYWHSEYFKDKLYHQQKSKIADDKNIFLYHIFEYEWENKKEQILNQLNNLLGLNHNKIYARKCEIKNVNNKDKKIFLDKNHLQSDDNSSIKLGLYYNDELVSLMTFCKPRFTSDCEWELSRFCSKAGYNIVGGASKLFKYFIRKYNPNNIITYSNIAHTKGNLYKLLGFNFVRISEPNYVWCNGHKILSRYQCQKHKLIEQGFTGSSEVDIMTKRGYYRIYDCGNKVWSWNNY